ncbi:MAG: glycosyltransferase family 4 protein [Anaerolineae bacterium]|nr:glycosyltransferase family 4 protein [Anaerolineae bacterium]
MHIGIDLRLHAYAPGGISRYARRLSAELMRILQHNTVPDNVRVTLLHHQRERDLLAIPGAHTRRLRTPPHHRWERWVLGAELLPLRLDLLHSTDFIPPAWGARRFVITVHDLNFLYYPQYLTEEARAYYNQQIKWAVTRADAILADSYATQRDLENLLNVPATRVTVTHLAADEIFRPLPNTVVLPILRRYALEPGYLLFVGTWEPRKNLPSLLDALARLHQHDEKRTLVIVGRPGWLYSEVFTKVQGLNLGTWVRFIEEAPVADLVAFYNGALLLAMPSFYEGFGLPALEAMQCGTPTVVADRASLPEVVGEAGLLINPEDPETIVESCLYLIRQPGLREKLRAEGLKQAATFTWAETARKTLEVYQRVLNH